MTKPRSHNLRKDDFGAAKSLSTLLTSLSMYPNPMRDPAGTKQRNLSEATDYTGHITKHMKLQLTPEVLESIWRNIWKKIWSYTIPSGRVVDIIFDEMSNSYFSYHAETPNLLHVCRDSREIGLRVYTLCFGTEHRPAVIPFDLERDCLFFSDYLAFPGADANLPVEPSKTDITLARVPVKKITCELEMTRIMGPISRYEACNVRRIALPSSFISLYAEEDSIQTFRLLFNTFTCLEYIVFAVEEPNPFTPGEILFCELQEKDWCCFNCVIYYHMTLSPLARSIKRECRQVQGDFSPVDLEIRVRGIVRGGVKCHTDSRHKHVGREQLPDMTHIDDDAEYMQRFTHRGATEDSAEAGEEPCDDDSFGSEDVERWERDEMDQEIEDLRADEKIFEPMYENHEFGFQEIYRAVYGALDLTGEKRKEIAKADKNKRKNQKRNDRKKENRQSQKGGGKEGESHGEEPDGEEPKEDVRKDKEKRWSDAQRHLPIINLDPWREDEKDEDYSH
ncbi:hypothetical protein QTJ16_000780 [Diplocarpon rosae]|uniref:2EXR domain-containing protein n=1 Tax=Diplocarpon rosae TaxID=946125 RepID=A0AAD9T7Q0_9HELO|nr:hypothetical protein QTJ16_000780 [Diplocarpon rosae]